MIPRPATSHRPFRWLIMLLWLLLPPINLVAELPFLSAPELVTNVVQFALPASTNVPARRLVTAQLQGTVLAGGNFSGVAVFDGSPLLHVLPAAAPRTPWERGQRIQIAGSCVLDGTNLSLLPQPLIENDGLHSMYERSAGVWLEPGKQPLRVRYFNHTGDRGLELSIAGPGLRRQKIPAAMLFYTQTNRARWTRSFYGGWWKSWKITWKITSSMWKSWRGSWR